MSSDRTHRINLNFISYKAHAELLLLDHKLLDSTDPEDYLGIAYFWGQPYKHALRDASTAQRVKVYRAWRKQGLDLIGESPEHEAIVRRVCGDDSV